MEFSRREGKAEREEREVNPKGKGIKLFLFSYKNTIVLGNYIWHSFHDKQKHLFPFWLK